MRRVRTVQRWLAVCLVAAAAGCATPRAGTGKREPPDDEARIPLSPERAAFADALAHYAAGLSREWNDDSEGALTNFLRAAELNPDDEELQFRVALILLREQRGGEAAELMRNLAARKPQSAQAQLWTAFIHRLIGQPAEALHYYRRASALDASNPLPYLESAALLARMNRFDEAVDILRDGLKRAREPQDILRMLVRLYVRQASVAQPPPAAARLAERALNELEPVIEKHPREESILIQVAALYKISGRLEDVLRTAEKIENLRPPEHRWRMRSLVNLFDREGAAPAVEPMRRLADEQPTNMLRQVMLAHLAEFAGDKALAESTYRRALELNPRDEAVLLRYGAFLSADSRGKEAIALLESAVRENPDTARLRELLAYAYLIEERFDDALELFNGLRSVYDSGGEAPLLAQYRITHAIAALYAGRIDDAVEIIEKEAATDIDFLPIIAGAMLRETDPKRRELGLSALVKLGERVPDNPRIFLYQGLVAGFIKRYAEAADAFARVEALAREQEREEELLTPSFYFWYGAARERLGQIDEAAELFKKCIAMQPEPANAQDFNAWVDAHNYLAYMWAERGLNLDEGLRLVNRALEFAPDNAAYIDTRGWIYFMQGRYAEARDEIERAVSLMPDDPTLADHMGDIYEKLGVIEEAIDWWTKALRLEPDNEKIAEKLRAHGVDVEAIRAEQKSKAEEKKEASPAPALMPPLFENTAPEPDLEE